MKRKTLCVLLLISLILTACGNFSKNTHSENIKENKPGTAPVARDFSWIITNGTLTIKGNGAMPDFGYDSESPWESQRESITKVVILEGITHIGNKAFYYCDKLSHVSIPNSVTSIGEQAFRFCKKLTAVHIPEKVTYIGDYAFGECWSLSSIAIYRRVEHIGTAAFSDCQALSEISVESTNQYYSSENGILFNKDKTALIRYPTQGGKKAYIIPDSVTVLEDGAFERCSNLEYIIIPNSVTTIGNFVFSGCFNLVSISIPGSVTSMGWDTFSHCYALTEIDVAFSNQAYASENGVLFSKDKRTLRHYPQGKTDSAYSVPQGVTVIGGNAFIFNEKLVSVSIPDGVTEICANAFWNCDRLASVSVPSSVTSIGASAFSDCKALKSITFNGTKAQWESIEKDRYSNSSFIVYCADGNINVNQN